MSEETRKERTLADEVKRFMEKEGISARSVAEKIGYSRPAVSQYLNGHYGAETAKLDEAMAAYLEEMTGVPAAVLINGRRQLLEHRGFYESDDAKCIQRLCQRARQDQALGLIVGKSGYGKTTALRLMGKRDQTVYIECAEIMSVRNLINTLERELKLCPYGNLFERTESIQEYLNNHPGWLILIDEADKLIMNSGMRKLETIRSLFDKSAVGLVLAGEPRLKSIIERTNERMMNRIGLSFTLGGLSEAEVASYLSAYDVEEEALLELTRRACNPVNGCFRLLDRTLRNCLRVMDERHETRITEKIIRQASGMMLL